MNSSGLIDDLDLLGLPGIRSTWRATEKGVQIVDAQTDRPLFPMCCDCPKLVLNGSKRLNIADRPGQSGPVRIALKRRQATCRACGKAGIYEELPHLKDGTRMTDRLYRFVMGRLRHDTFARIGRDVGLSEGTIRHRVHARIESWSEARYFTTPRVLGVDEKHLLGEYRGVLCDIERRKPVDLIADRSELLAAWFADLPDKDRVEIVTMDMFTAYRNMVGKHLPNAEIVVDRFHVQRRANDAFDEVRKRIMRGLTGAPSRTLARRQKLLAMRHHSLDEHGRETVDRILALDPALNDAYWAKEGYFDIYLAESSTEARERYSRWWYGLAPNIAKFFRQGCAIRVGWEPHVFSYFDHRYTNSYVESLNRDIDSLQRDGRGYSFDVMRFKLLAGELDFRALWTSACVTVCSNAKQFRFCRNANVNEPDTAVTETAQRRLLAAA